MKFSINSLSWCLVSLPLLCAPILSQRYHDADGKLRVALVKNAYTGARNVAELSQNPDYLEQGGIARVLAEMGVSVKPEIDNVRLTDEEEGDYGEWHRMGMANGHLADIVADNDRAGFLNVGLLGNCTSVIGMLGGLQHSRGRRPLKVGLVFIDSHGDFNTPETTLSGMLGGMPVAVSAGMCLTNLRLESGLNPALPTKYIVMGALRDVDPLEQDLIDRSQLEHITTDDIRSLSETIHVQMRRLSELTDVIYIHIDMDVLDPAEVPGHPLTVPDGPTSLELGAALTEMFKYDKAVALGIASTPAGERDPDGVSRKAAYNLIRGAIRGVQQRVQR
jgi:arginase